MSYEQRGRYNDIQRARQLLRFDGLEFPNHATPMDLDGFIDWQDKKRVLIEVKTKGVKLLWGERLSLQRMVDDFGKVGKDSIAIVADHTVFDKSEDVMVSECIVREIYSSREHIWRPPKRMITVRSLIDSFLFNCA